MRDGRSMPSLFPASSYVKSCWSCVSGADTRVKITNHSPAFSENVEVLPRGAIELMCCGWYSIWRVSLSVPVPWLWGLHIHIYVTPRYDSSVHFLLHNSQYNHLVVFIFFSIIPNISPIHDSSFHFSLPVSQ